MPTMFITKYIQSVQFCILSLVKVSSSEVSSSKISSSEISSAIVGGGQTSIGADNGSIVHKGSGGGHYTGVTGKDGGVSISTTLLPISFGSLNSSEMGSTGLSNLRGVLNRGRCDTIKYRGNQGLRVEGGCNSVIDRGNRQSGVSDTESSGISNIVNMLQLALSINIGVSSGDTTIGVSNLLLGRVNVGIAVVQVSELILGMELASLSIRSIGIRMDKSTSIRDRGGSNSGNRGNSFNGLSLNLDGGYRGSIGIVSSSIGEWRSIDNRLCLLSGQADRQKSCENCKKLH